jgi:predicted RecA/RadA family phage recombinase
MKNLIEDGLTLQYTVAGAAVKSGDLVVVGDVTGVAVTDGVVGETITLNCKGVYALPKASGSAISQGVKIYWDATNSVVTTTATSNKQIGFAWSAAASADTVLSAKLAN